MKMKTFFNSPRCLLVMLMAFGLSVLVQAEQGLTVKSSTGTTTSFSFSNVSKLTFANETMTVVSPSGVAGKSFALSALQGITFGEVGTNAIKETFTGNSKMTLYPSLAVNTIHLKGAKEGSLVSIYSFNGSKNLQLDVTSDLQSINVSPFKAGIYLLRVNGQTFKFCKQ